MWKHAWGYAEGWAISGGLFVTGSVLQLTVGRVDTTLLTCPVNLIAGGGGLLLLVLIYTAGRKTRLIQWLSGLTASITSLTAWLFLVIIMGLTRQTPFPGELSSGGVIARLGFMQMISSWPFILLFLYVLLVLGLVTIKRAAAFRKKDVPFFLNHAGLFITLYAAVLGNADLQRLRMTASLDGPEWRATDEGGRLQELPLAIELKSFTIDEYPPKLMLIDNESGKALPQGQPVNLLVEAVPTTGTLCEWRLEITHSLPMAACMLGKDTTNFVAYHSEGATSALHVRATNLQDGTVRSGWVSCGSYQFPYVSLRLNDRESLVMPEREPKRFASEVTLYTKGGERADARIEVNKPYTLGGWKIYQLSYDEAKGKWSRTSVFELVRDPWLPVVYTGIIMMLLGAVCLFVTAPAKPENEA